MENMIKSTPECGSMFFSLFSLPEEHCCMSYLVNFSDKGKSPRARQVHLGGASQSQGAESDDSEGEEPGEGEEVYEHIVRAA